MVSVRAFSRAIFTRLAAIAPCASSVWLPTDASQDGGIVAAPASAPQIAPAIVAMVSLSRPKFAPCSTAWTGSPLASRQMANVAGIVSRDRAQSRPAPIKRTAIGRSRGGRQIVSYYLGGDRRLVRRVLVLGGQHGSPEANTVTLADAIVDHFWHHEAEIPRGVGLDIITVANPDGFIMGSRQFLSGVDPNRNWASGDWEPDAYDSLGQFWTGLGGPAPMSEPETRVLASWIIRYRPVLVVNYHSAGGFVSTAQTGISWDLADVYGDASGYPSFGPDRPPFGYSITGAMDGWLAAHGIADLFVELSSLEAPEVDENLAGLSAVLAPLAP